jgi:hypothetical protein
MSMPKSSLVQPDIPETAALDGVISAYLVSLASFLCPDNLIRRRIPLQSAPITRSPAIGGSQ